MERGSKRKRLRAPSPAMVVACIALTVTLSGVSYAATKLAKNSVGTAQIRANAVNGSKVANDSLTGADVLESSLAGVNAATLGGHPASDFEPASSGGSGSYVASGATWADRDGQFRNNVQASYTAGVAGTKTQWCTSPSGSEPGVPAAFQDVHLPHGAAVTKMTADYRDDPGSTSSNGNMTLTRMPLFGSDAGGTASDIFNVTLGNIGIGEGASAFDNTPGEGLPSLGVIDNTRFSYALMGFPGPLGGVGYCAVRIEYNLP